MEEGQANLLSEANAAPLDLSTLQGISQTKTSLGLGHLWIENAK